MKKLLGKIYLNRNITYIGLFLLVAIIILGLPKSASAIDVAATLKNLGATLAASPILLAIGIIAALVMVLFGMIDTMIIGALVNISKYNDFISEPSISDAWVVVRDLCNMFFILILLVIAFATILRLPNYEWKKLLPKLLIMAILINFSKTICGLIIDFTQVIMLTFVNTWATTGGDFVDMTQMTKYFASVIGEEFKKFTSQDFSVLNIVAGMLIGIMFLIISGIVLLVALAVFTMRVVMLWIYIVLSPLAFLLSAFPAGQKYASQWWSEFIKYAVSGPILAFFIWLALISSRSITKLGGIVKDGENQCFGLTQGMCLNNFLPFIISIGMLIGGLMITQQLGGMAGSMAGKGLDWAKKSPMLLGKGLLKGTRTVGSWGLDKTSQLTKGRVDFNLARAWGRFKTQMDKNKAERAVGIEQKVAAKAGEGNRLAILTHGALAAKNLSSWGGIKGFAMGRGRFKYSNEAEKLEEERKRVLSNNDAIGVLKDQKTKKETLKTLQDNIALKDIAIRGKAVDDPERAKLVEEKKTLEDQYTDTREQIGENDKKLGRRTVDKATGKFKYANIDNVKAKTLDKEIADNRDKASKVALRGEDIVKGAEAEAVAIQEKKITHIDNFSELGEIFNQAIREGNVGLQAAVARKMTKNGDYNELARIMKVGTGTKGMQDLAKIMEKQGGMSQQMSRGLVADMGVICKNLGQFGGFASMEMDKSGNWQEVSEDKAQGVQLAEMQKMEPQAFARTVNRLGLGYYDDDGDPSKAGVHDESTWHLSKAAIIYLKTNQEALGEQYKRRGMQNAIEHLSSKIGQLAANGVKSGRDSLIETIEARGHKGGTDPMEQVKTVKKI